MLLSFVQETLFEAELEENPQPPFSSRYYSLFSRGKIDETQRSNVWRGVLNATHDNFLNPTSPTDSINPNCSTYSSCIASTTSLATPPNFQPKFPQEFEYQELPQYQNKTKIKAGKPFCEFCKNNNEERLVYTSHVLKDMEGRVVCPVNIKCSN
jgi:hypothetical protein